MASDGARRQKRLRDLKKKHGFEYRLTKKNHYVVTSPSGERYTTGGSPSDFHGEKKFETWIKHEVEKIEAAEEVA